MNQHHRPAAVPAAMAEVPAYIQAINEAESATSPEALIAILRHEAGCATDGALRRLLWAATYRLEDQHRMHQSILRSVARLNKDGWLKPGDYARGYERGRDDALLTIQAISTAYQGDAS